MGDHWMRTHVSDALGYYLAQAFGMRGKFGEQRERPFSARPLAACAIRLRSVWSLLSDVPGSGFRYTAGGNSNCKGVRGDIGHNHGVGADRTSGTDSECA